MAKQGVEEDYFFEGGMIEFNQISVPYDWYPQAEDDETSSLVKAIR
jgi:hypothetical protein